MNLHILCQPDEMTFKITLFNCELIIQNRPFKYNYLYTNKKHNSFRSKNTIHIQQNSNVKLKASLLEQSEASSKFQAHY